MNRSKAREVVGGRQSYPPRLACHDRARLSRARSDPSIGTRIPDLTPRRGRFLFVCTADWDRTDDVPLNIEAAVRRRDTMSSKDQGWISRHVRWPSSLRQNPDFRGEESDTVDDEWVGKTISMPTRQKQQHVRCNRESLSPLQDAITSTSASTIADNFSVSTKFCPCFPCWRWLFTTWR